MTMGCSWMKSNRLSKEYENRVIQFLHFVGKKFPKAKGIFWCPCKIFRNMHKHPRDEIFNHLGCDEIIQNYTK